MGVPVEIEFCLAIRLFEFWQFIEWSCSLAVLEKSPIWTFTSNLAIFSLAGVNQVFVISRVFKNPLTKIWDFSCEKWVEKDRLNKDGDDSAFLNSTYDIVHYSAWNWNKNCKNNRDHFL